MKKTNFSIVYFLVSFLILYYGFIIYVGLTTPGGKIYSPFLHNWVNIPYWLSAFIAKSSELLLKVSGYNAYQKNAANITIRESSGVTIAWGCLGVGVMIVWFSFVTAHRATFTYKLKWVTAGIVLIFVFNILRITSIVLSYYHHWIYFQSFNAHATFNFITYALIIILMLFFVLSYNKMEKQKSNIA